MTTEAQQAAATTQAPATSAAQPTQAANVPTQVSPAPAATPAAPATTTPAAAATKEAQPASPTTPTFGAALDYLETGNASLDYALKWAGQRGLNVETMPEMQQAMQGNFGPLRVLLESKQIPEADAILAMAEAGLRDYQAGKAAATQAVQAMVVDIAGGEDSWNQVMDWARENAEPEERDQINAALEQGGFVAEAVAARLVQNYRAQPGVTVQPTADPVKQTAAAQAASTGNGPLDPKAYGAAVQQLRLQLKGQPIEGTKEYQALQRRRMAYRG